MGDKTWDEDLGLISEFENRRLQKDGGAKPKAKVSANIPKPRKRKTVVNRVVFTLRLGDEQGNKEFLVGDNLNLGMLVVLKNKSGEIQRSWILARDQASKKVRTQGNKVWDGSKRDICFSNPSGQGNCKRVSIGGLSRCGGS